MAASDWAVAIIGAVVGVPSWLAWAASRRAARTAATSRAQQQAITDALGPIGVDVRSLHDKLDAHLAESARAHRDLAGRIRRLENAR